MKKASKKLAFLCAAAVATVTCSSAFADPADVLAITKNMAAIQSFSSFVNSVVTAPDNNLSVAAVLNPNAAAAHSQATLNASDSTQNLITSSLMEFPGKVVNADSFNDKKLTSNMKLRDNLVASLTTKIPGSDTLYLSSESDPVAALTAGVSQPKKTYDNYFNIDAVLSPEAYNSDQQTAAQAYLQYLTQQYKPLTDGLNLDKLKSNLNSIKASDRGNALKDLINSDAYRNYQLAVRSLLANQSVSLSNLNALIAERTPQKNLGKHSGLPNDPNLPNGYASPLQVENYIANERVNNKKWFDQLQTESQGAVNREQTVILAEINQKLQRNHADNERLLTTMTALLIQMSQTSQAAMKTQAQDVNSLIASVGQ